MEGYSVLYLRRNSIMSASWWCRKSCGWSGSRWAEELELDEELDSAVTSEPEVSALVPSLPVGAEEEGVLAVAVVAVSVIGTEVTALAASSVRGARVKLSSVALSSTTRTLVTVMGVYLECTNECPVLRSTFNITYISQQTCTANMYS